MALNVTITANTLYQALPDGNNSLAELNGILDNAFQNALVLNFGVDITGVAGTLNIPVTDNVISPGVIAEAVCNYWYRTNNIGGLGMPCGKIISMENTSYLIKDAIVAELTAMAQSNSVVKPNPNDPFEDFTKIIFDNIVNIVWRVTQEVRLLCQEQRPSDIV